MTIPKFDEKELNVVAEIPGRFPGMPGTPLYDFPVTRREAYKALMERKPVWQITGMEAGLLTPQFYPDNVARGFIFETLPLDQEKYGGKDMFGIEWVYVPVVGGSIVKPGEPTLADANEWYDKIVWPNIDEWDWEGSAKANQERTNGDQFITHWIMNGYYERLISFMDFEGAVMAMIDDDQKDAVKDLFERLTDLYIDIVDHFVDYFGAEGFCVHDDWGSQRAPFFSPATCAEMLVPAMRRLTDHIHSRGCYADFHSCGHLELQVPNMIAAGWDSWSGMPMNDTQMLYEKYGDQILIGVIPDEFDPETTTEEEQRAEAAKFVEKFCDPNKPCFVSHYGAAALTPAFREELYKLSRIRFSEGK